MSFGNTTSIYLLGDAYRDDDNIQALSPFCLRDGESFVSRQLAISDDHSQIDSIWSVTVLDSEQLIGHDMNGARCVRPPSNVLDSVNGIVYFCLINGNSMLADVEYFIAPIRTCPKSIWLSHFL